MTDAQELAVVLALVEAIAARHHDGKVTFVRSPAGWQVAFGVPANLPPGLENHSTLAGALLELVVEPVEI